MAVGNGGADGFGGVIVAEGIGGVITRVVGWAAGVGSVVGFCNDGGGPGGGGGCLLPNHFPADWVVTTMVSLGCAG